METDLGGFIFLSIPSSHIVLSRNLFKQHYTVTHIQEYEIVFARVGSTATQTVSRRYRQFRQLHTAISSLHVVLPAFPRRHWPGKLSYRLVESRRQMLEKWLLALLAQPLLRPSLHSFLDLTFNQTLSEDLSSYGDLLVAALLRKLHSAPHMKASALKDFDSKFFTRHTTTHSDRLLVLMEHLAELSGGDCCGVLALHLFSKLLSRDSCKAAMEATQQLQHLPMATLAGMRLHEHIAEGRNVFTLLKTLTTEFAHLGTRFLHEIVTSTQLNHDTEALRLYRQWEEGRNLDGDLRFTSQWMLQSDEPEMELKYRLIGNEIEVRARLTLRASLDAVIDALTQANKRRLWDTRLADVQVLDRSRNSLLLLFAVDCNCVRCPWKVNCTVQRSRHHQALVTFVSEQYSANLQITEVRQVSHSTADTEADEGTPTFFPSDDEEAEDSQCILVCEEHLSGKLEKQCLSAGESELLSTCWSAFSALTQGALKSHTSIELKRSDDLQSALERKSLFMPRSLSQRAPEIRHFEDLTMDRLARRMFA